MIRVYPSALEGEPLEQHSTSINMTMREWLTGNAPTLDLDNPPISISINGQPATLDCEFGPADVVDVRIVPRGAVAAIVIAVVALVIAIVMRPKTPKQQEQAKARALSDTGVTGNSVRYGDPIPEVFGRPPRLYPDYLLPPRTYYTEPRVQWVEALLCVGKGVFEKSIADIYIGDTRAPALGSDVELKFYEPGEDLSNEPAAQWWHTPQEVGFTSRGNAGMELGVLSNRTPAVNATRFEVAGDIISIDSGDDFPEDWVAGIELDISVPYPATVTAGVRDVITSDHAFSHFTPQIGMEVALGGDDDGTYKIHSYTPPSGTTPAVPGSPATYTGSASPQTDFSAAPAGVTIIAGGTYSLWLDSNYQNASGLLQAVNAQLNNTRLIAAIVGDKLQLYERNSPYSGTAISVAGGAHDALFGMNPVADAGVKTEPEKPAGAATITLSTLDGAPVNDLVKGQIMLSVRPTVAYEIISRISDRALLVSGADWAFKVGDDISVALDTSSADIGWTGPFAATPPDESCDALEFSYTFPSGLMWTDKKGRTQTAVMGVRMEYRIGSGAWAGEEVTHAEATPDGLGYTHRIELGGFHSEVYVRMRTTFPRSQSASVQNTVNWTGVRARMASAPSRYEGVTILAVKLRSGDRISSQTDNKIWLRATRLLPDFDGVMTPTRDLAPALMHIFKTCGYGNHVDYDALKDLHDIWAPRGDHFNYAATGHSTVKRLSNDILRAGFAELTIDRGLLTPVRDALRDAVNYIYSPQELTGYPVISTDLAQPDDIDGVDAEYLDEHTGKVETVKFRLAGDEGRRAEKIKLTGVTNWTRAWRLAARHRRVLAYRRTSFKGTTELHALNSSYMSLDRIQDGIPEYGQSCFVTAVDGLVIRVSEPLDWGDDKNRVIALRQLDGRLTAPVWVKRGTDEYELELLEPLPFAFDWSLGGIGNVDPTMLYFGRVGTWAHDVLITQITPKQDNTVDIQAVVYDERVYADDDRDPRNEFYLTSEIYLAHDATSLKYVDTDATSTLYPVEFDDSLAPSAAAPSASWETPPMDSMGISMLPPAVYRRPAVRYLTYDNAEPEALGVAMLAPSVSRAAAVRYLTYDNAEPESLAVAMLPPAVFRQKVADYYDYTIPEESMAIAMLAPTVTRTKI